MGKNTTSTVKKVTLIWVILFILITFVFFRIIGRGFSTDAWFLFLPLIPIATLILLPTLLRKRFKDRLWLKWGLILSAVWVVQSLTSYVCFLQFSEYDMDGLVCYLPLYPQVIIGTVFMGIISFWFFVFFFVFNFFIGAFVGMIIHLFKTKRSIKNKSGSLGKTPFFPRWVSFFLKLSVPSILFFAVVLLLLWFFETIDIVFLLPALIIFGGSSLLFIIAAFISYWRFYFIKNSFLEKYEYPTIAVVLIILIFISGVASWQITACSNDDYYVVRLISKNFKGDGTLFRENYTYLSDSSRKKFINYLKNTEDPSLEVISDLGCLESLSIGGAHNIDMEPISQLKEMKYLSLGDSNIFDISPLSGLIKLEKLYLGYNPLTDISPLKNLTKLEILVLRPTGIHNIDSLSQMKSLRKLKLRATKVSDLTALSSLDSLEYLNLENTPVTDISPLAELYNLKVLHLENTRVRDLSPLSKLPKLEELYLEDTPVSDLSPLANLPNLRSIVIYNTPVSDVSSLSGLDSLRVIRRSGSNISKEECERVMPEDVNCW